MTFVQEFRVRYNECDMQNVVFNANYFIYACFFHLFVLVFESSLKYFIKVNYLNLYISVFIY